MSLITVPATATICSDRIKIGITATTLPQQTVMKFAELASEVQIQRSQPARRDLGLPPGRRRANQLFKEVRKKLEVEVEGVGVEVSGNDAEFIWLLPLIYIHAFLFFTTFMSIYLSVALGVFFLIYI